MKTSLTIFTLLVSSVLADAKPAPEKTPPTKKRTGVMLDLHAWNNTSGNTAHAYVEARLTSGAFAIGGKIITFQKVTGGTAAPSGITNSAGVVRRAVPFNTRFYAQNTNFGVTKSQVYDTGPDPRQPNRN